MHQTENRGNHPAIFSLSSKTTLVPSSCVLVVCAAAVGRVCLSIERSRRALCVERRSPRRSAHAGFSCVAQTCEGVASSRLPPCLSRRASSLPELSLHPPDFTQISAP
ncbi:hypothetical protein SKAU_G00316650 [Synaphobranchus kaupii]|uniref:Uncharacterized protein n=1 Tax=Synaphobranchus kaupii TaxID=118154 RepID=A0A9Q1IKU6_SYNKA|nr:hypothetical protein SKAU_G00316650 [Synaphobranchus kaupii]